MGTPVWNIRAVIKCWFHLPISILLFSLALFLCFVLSFFLFFFSFFCLLPFLQTFSPRYVFFFKSTSLPLAGNFGRLTWVRHSSPKSSATHFYQCVQCFCVSRQWRGCQSFGIFKVHTDFDACGWTRGCTDTVRESALKVGSGEKISCRTWDSNPRQHCAWLWDSLPNWAIPVFLEIGSTQYTSLLPSVSTLIARGMFCGAKYTHHTFTPIIKHLITTTANEHPGKKSFIDKNMRKSHWHQDVHIT